MSDDRKPPSRSEEIAAADATLRANAELRADLKATQLYAAVLREALEHRQRCDECGGKGILWVDVAGEAESAPCDCWIRADVVLGVGPRPGAALLAELQAAREVVQAARASIARETSFASLLLINRDGIAVVGALAVALAKYDAALKESQE